MPTYPASAQIRLLAEAEVVVAPHGMGLVHLAFHRGPLKLVELFHPTMLSASYALLARAKGFDHVALFGEHVDDVTNDYVIDIDAVMAEIEGRD